MSDDSASAAFLVAAAPAPAAATDIRSKSRTGSGFGSGHLPDPDAIALDIQNPILESTVFNSINQLASPPPQSHQFPPQTVCAICDSPLPLPLDLQTVEIRTLKPRFLRELKRQFPLRPLPLNYRVCTKDLALLLQNRIETLLEQDQKELARLQNEAMRNLGEYEMKEQNWQKQFEHGWTFGEKAADLVARFGGSWRFIGCLLAFLFAWAFLNIIMNQSFSTVTPWDPYPFILLNLFLSMIAALQAPVIMMSQNRQAQLDRIQNDYVSTIILRSEHQVRHLNAKMDHLLNEQWRRLLEIQQTQMDLLQMLHLRQASHDLNFGPAGESQGLDQGMQQRQQSDLDIALFTNPNTTPLNPFGVIRGESFSSMERHHMTMLPSAAISRNGQHWSVETQPDSHVRMLLAEYFSLSHEESPALEEMLFAHWHTDGDNFTGFVSDIKVELKNSLPVVRRVVYDLTFNDPSATLDDVFAGEGTVELRNDMDVDCMDLNASKREDKVSDFWKLRLVKLNLTYSPPHQVAVLSLAEGQICERMRVDFFPDNNVNHAKVFMRRVDLALLSTGADALSYMKEVVGSRPLGKSWTPVAYALWPENSVPGSNLVSDAAPGHGGHGLATVGAGASALVGTGGHGGGEDIIVAGGGEDGEMLMEAGVVTVDFTERLLGPAVYVFLCDETRVAFQGFIV
ncbi:hypothetical protein HDU82_004244 [Entophlyctis luteolus]|nr:hypothetical protein HDU82_004244 [Entophlyctis luteolus]